MNRLKECRKNKRISQKWLASELNVSVQSISYWENGVRSPSKENLQKMAAIYGVSVDYLLGGINADESHFVSSDSQIDDELVRDIISLNEDEKQRVKDFVSGIKARKKS